MRIAWFRHARPDATNPLDEHASLIDALRATHDIDVIVERTAHDFVWQHLMRPWDLCVYELDNSDAHRFVRGYVLTYPGVALLRSTDLSRLGEVVMASRATVVSDEAIARPLRARYPAAHVRVAPPCSGAFAAIGQPNNPVKFAIFDERRGRDDVVSRATTRARDAGAVFDVLARNAPNTLGDCDVVISPAWPSGRHPASGVLAAMAAAKAVVTAERDATAGWPAIDPQSWSPRGVATTDPPIAVTIDPRDEEHSLMLAFRRLSTDAAARERLGTAAHEWWKTHATPAHAAPVWNELLEEAVTLMPPTRRAGSPAEYAMDGKGPARTVLAEFGLSLPD